MEDTLDFEGTPNFFYPNLAHEDWQVVRHLGVGEPEADVWVG